MSHQEKHLILIVEDDPLLSKMYSEKFTQEGFEVLVATDGEIGLSFAQERRPSAVLLDIMLPKRTGMDLLAVFHDDKDLSRIPVIALSNLADPKEAEKAKNLGARDYLVKAMQTPDMVVKKIKAIL